MKELIGEARSLREDMERPPGSASSHSSYRPLGASAATSQPNPILLQPEEEAEEDWPAPPPHHIISSPIRPLLTRPCLIPWCSSVTLSPCSHLHRFKTPSTDSTELFRYQILHLKLVEAKHSHQHIDTIRALYNRFGQPHQLALKKIASVL